MRKTSSSTSSSHTTSRQVNTLLHTLRGEHYRHAQNVRGSQDHIARATNHHTPNHHTLPIRAIFGDLSLEDNPPEDGTRSPAYSTSKEVRHSIEWREDALSLLFKHAPLDDTTTDRDTVADSSFRRNIPKLTQLCMRNVLPYCRGRVFAEVFVPCLHYHLRHDLLRWTAVNAPLTSSKLFALCGNDKHINGELIVVGPQSSLPVDYFQEQTEKAEQESNAIQEEVGDNSDGSAASSWESSTSSGSTPPATFTTLALVTTPLPSHLLFSLPPSLTHLALLALPIPTPIHRLPRICPLLEVLDLSYNPWLGYLQVVGADTAGTFKDQDSTLGNETVVERVEWSRLRQLRVLGLRDCGVGEGIVQKVNKGRWIDVEVVGVNPNKVAS